MTKHPLLVVLILVLLVIVSGSEGAGHILGSGLGLGLGTTTVSNTSMVTPSLTITGNQTITQMSTLPTKNVTMGSVKTIRHIGSSFGAPGFEETMKTVMASALGEFYV